MARTATAPGVPTTRLGKAAVELDERFVAANWFRRTLNKVFPDHWSFLLGEIALYSFVVLLLSGTYLTFFFDASMKEVVYNGDYAPLRGVSMSAAYDSTLNLSFDVRGGLFMRQLHHWAALLFVAAIVVHLLRIFFTGAFRRPGAHRAQRGRQPALPDVRGEGDRPVLHRVRHLRRAGRPGADQPGVVVGPVQPGAGLRGLAAGLVRHVPRRLHPSVPRLGPQPA